MFVAFINQMRRESQFKIRRSEAEAKARLREERTGRDCYDWDATVADGKWYFLDKRPHCANCNKIKGSKAKNRYFPERPCTYCGSTKTKLRDFDGNEISWDKWAILQEEAALAEMASECGYCLDDYGEDYRE
jgi:hypothetical protein